MTAPTFPFSAYVDYTDWRGREHEILCEGRYSFDGETVTVQPFPGIDELSDSDIEWLEDHLLDEAHRDYAEWQQEQADHFAEMQEAA